MCSWHSVSILAALMCFYFGGHYIRMWVHTCFRIVPKAQRSVALGSPGWTSLGEGQALAVVFYIETLSSDLAKDIKSNGHSLVLSKSVGAHGHALCYSCCCRGKERGCPLGSNSSVFEKSWSLDSSQPRLDSPDWEPSAPPPGPQGFAHHPQHNPHPTSPPKGLLNSELRRSLKPDSKMCRTLNLDFPAWLHPASMCLAEWGAWEFR